VSVSPEDFLLIRPDQLSRRERYELLTSLVVPRPIGWISTRSRAGVANLAPFSYFAALASNPLLVGVSIGMRKGRPKDTLANIRAVGAFCVNVCSEDLLEAMNLTSGEYEESVDEFALAGLTPRESDVVAAPWVGEAPAVLECRLFKEMELGEAPNTFVIGEVLAVRLSPSVSLLPGSLAADPLALRPVGRLAKDRYFLPGEVRVLPRPK